MVLGPAAGIPGDPLSATWNCRSRFPESLLGPGRGS